MSKWTDWIPHEGDECPVANDEKMKLRFEGNPPEYYTCVIRPTSLGWSNSPCRHARITHYKRLRKNVEAKRAKETKAAAEKSWTEANERANDEYAAKLAREATPKLIITGPGEYKTRRGEKIIISAQGLTSGWLGSFPWSDNLASWHSDGAYSMAAFPVHDIIGPWTEDTADLADTKAEEPEMWVNVYQDEWGQTSTRAIHHSKKSALDSSHSHECIGTYKLVKGE